MMFGFDDVIFRGVSFDSEGIGGNFPTGDRKNDSFSFLESDPLSPQIPVCYIVSAISLPKTLTFQKPPTTEHFISMS